MNDNMKIKYFDEELEVYDERRVVNKNTYSITLNYVPSPTRPLTVENGKIMLTETTDTPNANQYVLDRENGLLLFNKAMKGKVMTINYSAIGLWCISADKVYTNVDNKGEIIETLEDLMRENRQAIESIKTVGDASIVITQLQANIDSVTGLVGNIAEGSSVNEELTKSITSGKGTNTTLTNTISNANNKIDEMNTWVNQHGDIVNLDNRVDTVEVEIPKINNNLDTKANKDYYEVVFNNITPLVIDVVKLQTAINEGAKYIKFPSNCRAVMEETIFLLNHCKIYGENTTLYKDNADEPFFTNILPEGSTRLEGVEINKIEFEKKTGTAYHIELIEPYKCKVYKCKFIGNPNSDGIYIPNNKSGVKFEKRVSDTCFVNYIEKCYFSKGSIFMSGSDSYIRNNVIWGHTQEEAIRLFSASNIDISNNQIVGGKVNGAIYADINGKACGVSRIINNFFDGSYDEIESGIGLNGYFTLCDISKNTFYNQSKGGIKLYNPNGNTIEGNTFTQNNKDGDGVADIILEYEGSTSFMNSINNNTFNNTRDNVGYLCVKDVVKGGSPVRYNHFIDNIAPIGTTYADFSDVKTSGVIDNNQFRSKKITNKVYLEKYNGTISTSYEGVIVKYNVHGGSVSLYIHCIDSNLTIPAGGELILCSVPEQIRPFFEVDVVPSEFGKASTLRLTLITDGTLKITNWNATSAGEQIVNNLKATLTYTLK